MKEQFLDAIAASIQRVLRVRHVTRYQYDRPVDRAVLRLILRPRIDVHQRVASASVVIEPRAVTTEYEDVFGNQATKVVIDQPFESVTITSDSVVALTDIDPFAFCNAPMRPSFPLSWMPWERTLLQPYLTPVELPETQLQEIFDYAMSFVEANNHDLMETLFAINLTLFREFAYVPGSTSLVTTPFDVLQTKKGVCQDFANLFITMARLLNLPARYVCGYIHTGNTGPNRAQSDASHAWVQLYLPNIGWKGFDPTNGVLTHTSHIRVGYGRHFRDCTPTTGTVYSPARETMSIDVEVKDVTEPTISPSSEPPASNATTPSAAPPLPTTSDPSITPSSTPALNAAPATVG